MTDKPDSIWKGPYRAPSVSKPISEVDIIAELSEASLEKIRAIVREEIALARAQEDERQEEANPAPRVIYLPVEHPRTATVEYIYEGVKYVGVLTEIEEKREG